MEINPQDNESGDMKQWVGFFSTIMKRDLGELSNEVKNLKEEEELNKHHEWKLKGAVCQASHRLLQKFGNL